MEAICSKALELRKKAEQKAALSRKRTNPANAVTSVYSSYTMQMEFIKTLKKVCPFYGSVVFEVQVKKKIVEFVFTFSQHYSGIPLRLLFDSLCVRIVDNIFEPIRGISLGIVTNFFASKNCGLFVTKMYLYEEIVKWEVRPRKVTLWMITNGPEGTFVEKELCFRTPQVCKGTFSKIFRVWKFLQFWNYFVN